MAFLRRKAVDLNLGSRYRGYRDNAALDDKAQKLDITSHASARQAVHYFQDSFATAGADQFEMDERTQTKTQVTSDLPGFLDRRQLVYSFSMLNSYRSVCPQQMFQTYIKRSIPYAETPERKKGNDLHKAMEYRVPGGKPLPDGMQQYEQFAAAFDGRNAISEPELAVTRSRQPCGYWDDKTNDPVKRVFLRGRADVVVLGTDTAYLGDWKTGNDNIKYEDPFELAVQALLLQAKYPNLKQIMGQYIWLKTTRLSQMYDLSDTNATWSEVNRLVVSIEADRTRGFFEKKRSGLCGYCGYKECENWRPRQ